MIFIPVLLWGLFFNISVVFASDQSPINIQIAGFVNDNLFPRQENLFQMNIPQAWSITTGGDIVVAVIDTGVREQHEDIVGKLWDNPEEIPGNRKDDDGNGYVDDIHGYNFMENNNDISDQNSHGTGIASIIAANTNNTKGIAGINWQAKIMVLKALNKLGGGEYNHVVRAIHYAVENGAKVINMSFGTYTDNPELKQAIEYAIDNNVVVVAAAGNNNKKQLLYPAGYPDVISVGAVDEAGERASFSNYGENLDVMAPGIDIPAASNISDSTYASNSGTSYAAAHITGLASLILSKFSNWKPYQVELAMKMSATNQKDELEYGNGLVNAVVALNNIQNTDKLSANIVASKYDLLADGNTQSQITIEVKKNGALADNRWIYMYVDNNHLKVDGQFIQNNKFELGKTDSNGKIIFNVSSYVEGEREISFFDNISSTKLGEIHINFNALMNRNNYDGIVVNQSSDLKLDLGEEAELWVEFKNIGDSLWLGNDASEIGQVKIGTSGPNDRDSKIEHPSWISHNRIATFDQAVVNPGETIRISFLIKGNQPGEYSETFELVSEYKAWLPKSKVSWSVVVNSNNIGIKSDDYGAELVDHSSDLEIRAGESVWIDVTFKNSGDAVWSNGNKSEYGAVRLGTANPNDRDSKFEMNNWLSPNRVIGTGVNVNVADKITMKFSIKAPDVLGTYYESFRLVSEHITWFGPMITWKIKVI